MTFTVRAYSGLLLIGTLIFLMLPEIVPPSDAQVGRPGARKPTPTPTPTVDKSDKATSSSSGNRPTGPSIPRASWPQFVTVTLDEHGKLVSSQVKTADYITEDLGDGVKLDLVKIPSGEFMMGSPDSGGEGKTHEGPQHKVNVPEFYLGKYEVTIQQWVALMGDIPDGLDRVRGKVMESNLQPVVWITWHEAVAFCRRLQNKSGKAYRLPTEAEWEYAARAGTTTPFAFGTTITPSFAVYNTRYKGGEIFDKSKSAQVGSLGVANAFGLFDMHGNVGEWCQDVWHANYSGAPDDGTAWSRGDAYEERVIRGGSWVEELSACRSTARRGWLGGVHLPFIGFRVALTAKAK